MKVIQYIKEHGIQSLKEELGINIRDYPDRVVLNYSQIDSPKRDPIVKECRALILRKPACKEDDWIVLVRAFDRFFNLGECPPAEQKQERALIHHPNLVVLEKLDGSIMNIYHEAGERWNVASSGMAFAEGPTPQGNTFRDVFEKAIRDKVENRFKGFDSNYTYIFEMVSPETRVVTPYLKEDIYLLAVRSRKSEDNYREWSWEDVKQFAETDGFKIPREYKFNTLDEILKSFRSLGELEEGYVCRLDMPDGVFRVKIKNPKYLAIAHLRNNGAISRKRIALLVMLGEYDEYLSYFPEDRKFFDPYISAYGEMIKVINGLRSNLDIENQKDFALSVKDSPVASVMFQLRKGKDLEDIFENLTDDNKLRILENFLS